MIYIEIKGAMINKLSEAVIGIGSNGSDYTGLFNVSNHLKFLEFIFRVDKFFRKHINSSFNQFL